MKGIIVGAVTIAALVPAAGAGAQGNDAIAQLSNPAPGAQSALSVRLHGELRCGRLAARVFVLRLPDRMSVPSAIDAASVRVGGATPSRVAVQGRTVSVTMPLRPAVMCDSITEGWFPIAFARSAGLRNPRAGGSYAFVVSAAPAGTWRGTMTVR